MHSKIAAFTLLGATLPFVGAEAQELRSYLEILLVFGAPLVVHPTVDAALNTLGKTRASMWVQGIAVAANTVLSAVFVLVFGWGVRGAALGTVLGTGLAVGVGLYWLDQWVGPIRPRLRFAGISRIIGVGGDWMPVTCKICLTTRLI